MCVCGVVVMVVVVVVVCVGGAHRCPHVQLVYRICSMLAKIICIEISEA